MIKKSIDEILDETYRPKLSELTAKFNDLVAKHTEATEKLKKYEAEKASAPPDPLKVDREVQTEPVDSENKSSKPQVTISKPEELNNPLANKDGKSKPAQQAQVPSLGFIPHKIPMVDIKPRKCDIEPKPGPSTGQRAPSPEYIQID